MEDRDFLCCFFRVFLREGRAGASGAGAAQESEGERSHSVGEDLQMAGGRGHAVGRVQQVWIFWMLCLVQVPRPGIIWFLSVLATGPLQVGPFPTSRIGFEA